MAFGNYRSLSTEAVSSQESREAMVALDICDEMTRSRSMTGEHKPTEEYVTGTWDELMLWPATIGKLIVERQAVIAYTEHKHGKNRRVYRVHKAAYLAALAAQSAR